MSQVVNLLKLFFQQLHHFDDFIANKLTRTIYRFSLVRQRVRLICFLTLSHFHWKQIIKSLLCLFSLWFYLHLFSFSNFLFKHFNSNFPMNEYVFLFHFSFITYVIWKRWKKFVCLLYYDSWCINSGRSRNYKIEYLLKSYKLHEKSARRMNCRTNCKWQCPRQK